MTRFHLPLSVVMFVSIATMTLLLESSFTAQACLSRNGDAPLESNLNPPNAFTHPSDESSGHSKRQLLLDFREVAGFGAVVGLLAIAILYRARHICSVAPGEADLMSQYPHLEHPEMILAIVPQEALPTAFDSDRLVVR